MRPSSRKQESLGWGRTLWVGMEQEEIPAEGNPVTPQTRSSIEGEGTATRRKRKKKKEQMESIIVYRTELQEQHEDGAEGESGEGGNVTSDIAEEGTSV